MIISCIYCRQRNRVPDAMRHDGDYRCAKCKRVLLLMDEEIVNTYAMNILRTMFGGGRDGKEK